MTHPAIYLASMRARTVKNRVLAMSRDVIVKTGVVIFGMTVIAALTYTVAYFSFGFIEDFPAIGGPLNERLLSLFFLILLVMVALSTAVISYATLFLSKETEYLFQLPVPPRTIFFAKIAESAMLSAWATLFLGLPVLTAFGQVRSASSLFYLEASAALLIFLLFCGCAGAGLTLLLLEVVRRWTWRRLLLVTFILMGFPAWVFLHTFDFGALDGEQNLQVLDRFARGLPILASPFFPGHWIASLVVSAASGLHREVLFQGGLLVANTAIWFPLFAFYSGNRYSWQWLSARDGSSRRVPVKTGKTVTAVSSSCGRTVPLLSTPMVALSWKDMITFVRDPGQITQFVLFLLLMLVYIVSLLQIPRNLFGEGWRLVVYFANLGAISLILSSFTSRFLFPLISLEGKSFWIVGLAPISRSYLVRQKLFLGALVILLIGEGATLASTRFLGFDWRFQVAGVYTVFLVGSCLTALASGLGAAYPSMDEDNPARISVGLGGTLNFFSSAAAVVILLTIQGMPHLIPRLHQPVWILASHGLALVFTLVVVGYALRLGRRSLERKDF